MKFSYVLCILLAITSCKKGPNHLEKITAKTISIDSTLASSNKIDSVITPYKEKLEAEMQEVLTYAPKDFLKNEVPGQSSLGNLMADICFDLINPLYKEKTGNSIDFVLFNHGGIRATIPQGKVTVERAFKLMPFENEFVVVTLTGKKINELVQFFIDNKRAHPLSKNVELRITGKQYTLKINGEDFDKNKSYNVLTSDYLQTGGDNMLFFKNPKELVKLDYKIRDALIDHFKKTDTLQASVDNRVIIK